VRHLAISVTFLLLLSLALPFASAHDQKELTIILGKDGPTPDSIGEGVLVETDNLFFVNVDDRNNSSHRIQIDVDDDGIFDGIDDFSTQWLTGSCEIDENGSKIDNECMVNVFFLLAPENGLLPGNISMMHQIKIDSEESNHPFYINFGPDTHSPNNGSLTFNDYQAHSSQSEDDIIALSLVLSLFGILILSQRLLKSDEEE